MLRLPPFTYHEPESLAAAVALLGELTARGESCKVIAGGTDLLPNMKHEITTPAHLISLRHCGLQAIKSGDDALRIGAMASVQRVAEHPEVRERLPALGDACHAIAGPQLRRMGTLGGNVMLDTRCLYINQTYFWREALGFCLKKDGTVCHVVKGGQRCVAAASNDSALPLWLYGATLRLLSPRGERTLPIAELFIADGVFNKDVAPDEILAEITVPWPAATSRVAFEKLRLRKDIDYPLLNLAVRVDMQDDGTKVGDLSLVVSALGSRPKAVSLGSKVAGAPFDDALIALAAERAYAAAKPLTNIATDAAWRRDMVPVLTRRALERLRRG